jgi:hypothetical protein
LAATTTEQIHLIRFGTSSFRHLPSSCWTAMVSSSKCTGSSLTFARGLRWWQAVAACVDFRFKSWQQKQQWMET